MRAVSRLLMLALCTTSLGFRLHKSSVRARKQQHRSGVASSVVPTASEVNSSSVQTRAENATAQEQISTRDLRLTLVDMYPGKGTLPTRFLGKLRIPSAWNRRHTADGKYPCIFHETKLDSASAENWRGGIGWRDAFFTQLLPHFVVDDIQVFSMELSLRIMRVDVHVLTFGHWGFMMKIRDPVMHLPLYAAVHRVQRAWECISMSNCNHVEIGIWTSEGECRRALTTAVLPSFPAKYTVSSKKIDIGPPIIRQNAGLDKLKFGQVMQEAANFMDKAVVGFSLAKQNCRDFLRSMLTNLVWVTPEAVRQHLGGLDTVADELRQILGQFGWRGYHLAPPEVSPKRVTQPKEGNADEVAKQAKEDTVRLRVSPLRPPDAEPCVYYIPDGGVCKMGHVVGHHCAIKDGNSGDRRCEPECTHPENQQQPHCHNFGVNSCQWENPAGSGCTDDVYYDALS